jgi:hypothetical protein
MMQVKSSRISEKLTKVSQAAFFFLIVLLPLQMKYSIFSFLNKFLTSGHKFPQGFMKHWYFYLTDLSLLFFAVLVLCFSYQKLKLYFSGNSKYFTLVFLISFISILFSSTATCPIQYVRLLHLSLILTFFCALEHGLILKDVREAFPKICAVVLGVSLIQCSIAFAQYIFQDYLGLQWLGEATMKFSFYSVDNSRWLLDKIFLTASEAPAILRSSGTLPHPNVFGGYMMAAIPMTYYLFFKAEKRTLKILLVIAIFLQVLALSISFSRSALIGWGVASCLFWFFSFKLKENPKKLIGVAVGSLIICLIVLFPTMRSRGGIVNYNPNAQSSDQGRFLLQNIAFSMIKSHPVLGVGYNNYLVHMQAHSPVTIGRMQTVPVHNIYLLIAAESGLIALACFMVFLASICKVVLKSQRSLEQVTLFSIFAGLLFIGFCDFYFWTTQHGQLLFFLIAGLLSSSCKKRIA